MKKARWIYGTIVVVLLLAEIWIGLFVHDRFIRPYFGDVLITILLCCLCRTVFPKGIALLPLYVFIFATLVEILQYLNVVELLGLENNTFICTLVGTSFSFIDLICYGIGCFVFWASEAAIKTVLRHGNRSS